MTSLNKKLSLLLLSLFIIVGILLAIITRYSTIQYNLEITQRLNGSIAAYIAKEEPLIMDGKFNDSALKKLAHQTMVINPTVEVYLLSLKGKVLTHNLPTESVKLKSVPLAPINQFLTKNSKRPILNSDPRSPSNHKPFSVAKIINNGVQEGYIYVILGGQKYENLANNISKNYNLQLAFYAILAVIIIAFLMGNLMLSKLTKPLKTLRDKVISFQKSSNDTKKQYQGDEIEQLNNAFTDMSHRIDHQLEQIKNSDQARRDLITNVSHDLRTPLSSMQGYLDTLLIKQNDMDTQTTQEYLSIARKHCGRLSVMISDLFELSKLDSNIIKPKLNTFSMAELIQDICMEFIHDAKKKGLNLNMQLLEGNTNVMADISLMQRVLENLISNAIKHTPRGGDITVKLEKFNDSFKIIVQDTGRGISEHELPNIFNRLYRAENTSNDLSTSSGLGLAIVRKILEIHNSKIKVISRLNKGTMFFFSLPLAIK